MFLHEPLPSQHIWITALNGSAARRVTSGGWTLEFVLPPGSPPSGLSWSPDSKSMLVAGNDRTTTGVWIQPLDGAAKCIDTGDLVVSGTFGYDIAVASTGALVFTATTPSRPAQVYVMDTPTSAPRRLSNFNAWAGGIATQAIVGDAGAGPGRDVMAGVAMLRAKPYVDKYRTAVTGWS